MPSQSTAPSEGEYLTLDQVLLDIHKAREPRRVALSITGGGARGAYEAGAVEALLQAFHAWDVYPDVIAGTSVGALIGTGLMIDLLFPVSVRRRSPPLSQSPIADVGSHLPAEPGKPENRRQAGRLHQGAKQREGHRNSLPGMIWNGSRVAVQGASSIVRWPGLFTPPGLQDHLIDDTHLRRLLLDFMGRPRVRAGTRPR